MPGLPGTRRAWNRWGTRSSPRATSIPPRGTLYSILLASDDSGKDVAGTPRGCAAAASTTSSSSTSKTAGSADRSCSLCRRTPFCSSLRTAARPGGSRPLFSETRAGSILQFWFSSRNNGSLVVDRGQGGDLGRYELYETPNGGETWMLRETNERPSGSSGRRAPARTGASAPMPRTKAFAIERRQGEKWAALGAFAVGLPVCRPREPRTSTRGKPRRNRRRSRHPQTLAHPR